MTSGFTATRAQSHDLAVAGALRAFESRGIVAKELPIDGHNPDIELETGELVDIKTSDRYRCLAVELQCFMTWDTLTAKGRMVLILHRDKQRRWWVDTPYSLRTRIIGGPIRSTTNGSNDDWHKIAPGGTPVEEWF